MATVEIITNTAEGLHLRIMDSRFGTQEFGFNKQTENFKTLTNDGKWRATTPSSYVRGIFSNQIKRLEQKARTDRFHKENPNYKTVKQRRIAACPEFYDMGPRL